MKMIALLLSLGMCAYAQLELSDPAQKSGEMFGEISIPAIDLIQPVRSGVDASIIDIGVAHWPGSAKPGEPGNMVLAGHRTTKTAPFLKIEKLKVGDVIMVTNKDQAIAKYQVYEMFVVDPVKGWFVTRSSNESVEAILTIFTCHPLYSNLQRFVVRARLVK